MELDGLHSVLEERDFEGRSFWTPTTPAKPLDGESSKNETRQVNWEESSITPNWCPPEGENFEEYPPGFDPRGRTDGEIGYFELTNSVYQKGLPPLHSFVQINNNSFVDLLARTVSTNSSHGATDLSFPESHFQSHPDDLLCQYLQNNGARAHEEIRCEFPPMLSYDLNLFPETNAYEEYNKRIPQFAPTTPGYTNKMQIKQVEERPGEVPDEVSRMASPHFTCTTPDQVKWAENIQIPDIRNFFVDEQENQMQKNADSSGSIAAAVLHEKESVSDVAILISRNEIQNPEKMEKDQGIDLNKTPGQKPKRKKHRPKVVSERKPRGTTTPKTPKPASAKEKPTVKRKYVRKNGASKANSLPTEHVATDDPKTPEPARKSCKKSLNFELENQERCISFEDRIQSTVQIDQRTEATAENIQQSVVNGVTRRVDEMSGNRVSLPDFLRASARDEKISQTNEATRLSKQGKLVQILHEFDVRSSPISPEDSNCSTSTNLASSKKRGQYPYLINQANPSTHNIIGIQYNSLAAYERIFSVNESNGIPGIYFPKVYKRRRSEKAQATHTHGAANANDLASRPDCHLSGALNNASAATLPTEMCHQNQWIFNSIQALGRIERLRKKRSERPTRPRYSTSMAGTAEQKWLHNFLTMQASMNGDARRVMAYHPRTFIEAQANISATMARRKRSARRRNSSVSYLSPRTGILYDNSLALVASSGPNKKVGKLMQSIDALVEKMKGLHISRESYQAARKRYNALVPYNMVGTIIPYPIKRRRPRPKVELDEETTRVWKLLLENIDNEGIDGTDEANIKWWDEVRRRSGEDTNTFISRMRLVQGIRRFSRWGGSVVDSVVGVFLTQNVADHLSSSAFMSLAAHFPLEKRNKEQCYEERVSILTEEPDSSIVDSEETTRSNVTSVNIPVCDQTSVALHDSENSEEKEVVNSNEFSERRNVSPSLIDDSKCKLLNSFGSNLEMYHGAASGRLTAQFLDTETAPFERTAEEIVSSQSSVISSQSSVESSAAQTARRTISCQESYPGQKNEASTIQSESPHDSTSFMELLHKAGNSMLTDLFSHQSGHISYDSQLKDVHNKSEIECSGQEEYRHEAAVPESSSKVHGIPSTNNQFHPNSKIRVPEVEELYAEENRYHGIMTEEWKKQMANSQESTKFCTDANQYNSFHEDRHDINQSNTEHGAGPKNVAESKSQGKSTAMHQSLRALEEILDVTESNCLSSTQKSTENRSVGTHPRGSGTSSADSFSKINAIAPKENKGGNSQDKSNQFDWDSLRRQAEANCGRRDKRSAKTMDSVDWEAVRTADVNEIANTIKERGMNNVLAERIKDFLNRLVREHGSIDLEWLRDVPPDKAKEYLLSIRGLGLKSVECVRLLTLHHLAFPVDTNVGRIAVRLGWVPLQPLPESLQLHLLELYPVLESIQKYLWPRLCKLDQETLYELHYQMITFGKVFCTKNKPNCNACPMRAECRHFASAFASARLALPGPEEKSIVTATEQRANQKPLVTTKLLQLDLHQESQQTEENQPPYKESGIVSCQPIVEEPASPEPEHTQIASDIEDAFSEVPDEIPTIKLNIEAFTQNLHNYMQGNMELQEHDMSKALVALTPEIASIPVPKLKNVSRLRTEHQVYELPDSHPLLKGLDMREPDDPCPYLLAIWTPGETATSIQPPEMRCSSQEFGNLCEYETCFSCNSIREANSQTVRGTLLIPCRTAMRGSFPLNGTYFQVNEVFADHDSSINPVPVPRDWIWNLPRRTVYFGTSIPTIFKGLSTESIQFCFWRGYVCVRGFDQKTRAPRPLLARLHFPASKLNKTKGQTNGK